MNWKGIPYVATDVNPLTKAEIAFSKEYRKVPIAMIGDRQLNDSSVIMEDLIKSLRADGVEILGSENAEISKWLKFVDTKLAVVLFPNITRNMYESWEAFGYINSVPHFGMFEKFVLRVTGSVAMRLANSKIKRKYAIDNERTALLIAINEWVKEGLQGKEFCGGKEPNLADVAVYGCLKSIEAFTAFAWLIEESPKEFLIWFNRMEKKIPNNCQRE